MGCHTHVDRSNEEDVQDMVKHLSEDEMEIAANSSYEYFTDPLKQDRMMYVNQMAARYLDASRNDKTRALERMKDTIKFRQEKHIDKLRVAINDPLSDYHTDLKKSLSSRYAYVQGYDREGRSTFFFVPRRVNNHQDLHVYGLIWTMERAIACSQAQDKTINAVVDFSGFSAMHHAPPMAFGQTLMTMLRNHYVGYINRIFLIDAPSAFLCLWAIFKPFAGRKTREKIVFVSSNRQKEVIVRKWYNPNQATSWMLPSGTMNRALDLEEYLHETPFDRAFDDQIENGRGDYK